MAIFLIATGPALALLARLTEWRADRKHASLSPKVEINPIPWSNATYSYTSDDFEAFKARNRGDHPYWRAGDLAVGACLDQ